MLAPVVLAALVAAATLPAGAAGQALVVDLNGAATAGRNFQTVFVEDSLSVRIGHPALTITGPAGSTVTRLSVALTVDGNVPQAIEEGLVAETSTTGLSQHYDTQTGVLVITGAGTIDAYAETLSTLRYFNFVDEPGKGETKKLLKP